MQNNCTTTPTIAGKSGTAIAGAARPSEPPLILYGEDAHMWLDVGICLGKART